MVEVIRFEKVSLWRRTQEEFSYDFKKTILSFAEGKYRKPIKKIVLDHIDLTVNLGDKVGIIGANGSGKSTLLKVICGILQPSYGVVRVKGEIAPLIELGAGFDENLSVKDNIVMYGVILGFSRCQMKQRAPFILEFAELKDYTDAPVKALSSGMVARLGFAVATEVQPNILILDEVLSVGDENFKKKCQQRMQDFWQAQVTVLLVSHDLELVKQSCERAVWLDKGCLKMSGKANDVVDAYLTSIG